MQAPEMQDISRGELAAVVDALPAAIMVVDTDGFIVFANQRLRELSLYGSKVIGQQVRSVLLDDLFARRPDWQFSNEIVTTRMRRRDGFAIEVEAQLSIATVGLSTYAVASLVASGGQHDRDGELLRSFAELAPVMMFSLQPDGVIQSVNRAFEQRTGWCRDDLIGTHFAPLIHPDDLTDAMNTLGQILRNEETSDDEVRIRTTSGDYVLTQTHIVPLSDRSGRTQIVGIAHDITERAQTEHELNVVRERFRQAFKQAPFGVALLDPDGQITNANSALCDFLGYSTDELIGCAFSTFVHPDDAASELELVRHFDADALAHCAVEQRYMTKSGDMAYGSMSAATILNDEGRPAYMMRTVEDITEKRRLERELASHAAIAKAKLTALTSREREVLEVLTETVTAADIGQQIFVSPRTVESHLGRAYRKLGVRTRVEAVETYARLKDLLAHFEPSVDASTSAFDT
jgi:PAS domain S-box-containing protein